MHVFKREINPFPFLLVLWLVFVVLCVHEAYADYTTSTQITGDLGGHTSSFYSKEDQNGAHWGSSKSTIEAQNVEIEHTTIIDDSLQVVHNTHTSSNAIHQRTSYSQVTPSMDTMLIDTNKPISTWIALIERKLMSKGESEFNFSAVSGEAAYGVDVSVAQDGASLYLAKDRMISGYVGDADTKTISSRFDVFYSAMNQSYTISEEIYNE